MELMLGRDISSHGSVFLDATGSRAMLVCGKRGSGKSYTLGVLLEELVTVGSNEVIPIIVDPMGIYHTMVKRNERENTQLFQWGLNARSFPVRLLIPGAPEELYDREVLDVLTSRDVEYE